MYGRTRRTDKPELRNPELELEGLVPNVRKCIEQVSSGEQSQEDPQKREFDNDTDSLYNVGHYLPNQVRVQF